MLTSVAPLSLAPRPQRFAPVWLVGAIVISVLVHILVLFVQFVMPESKTPSKAVIEMILVNDYNQARNAEAKVFANAALQGGGEAESGRKTSPLARSDGLSQLALLPVMLELTSKSSDVAATSMSL